MPLFSNKFIPKKTPVRKAIVSEIGRDIDSLKEKDLLEDDGSSIKLSLGNYEAVFENGQWIPASNSDENLHKNNQKLRKQIQSLKEENNLLKLKFEILLDMLTETTAENHIQQREIDKFKKNIK